MSEETQNEQAKPQLSFGKDDGAGVPPGIEDIPEVEGRAEALKIALGQSVPFLGVDVSDQSDDADPPKQAMAVPTGGEPALPTAASPVPAPAPAAAPPAAAAPPPGPSRAERFEAHRREARERIERAQRERDAEQLRTTYERQLRSVDEDRKLIEPLLRIIKTKDAMALHQFVGEHFAPDELAASYAQWTNDEARTRWHAQSAQKAAETAAERRVAQLEQQLEELVFKPQREAAEKATTEQVYEQFATIVEQFAERAPYSARALKRDKQALFALADAAASMFQRHGKGFTAFDVIDYIERNFADSSAPSAAAHVSTGQSATQNAQAKATTVTNRHAADETTVIPSNEPQADESMDDVVRRLQREWNGRPLQQRR